VGNPVQKILQGRGDKKRQKIWLKRGLPFLFLLLTYLGLLFEFPLKKEGLWFLFSSATVFVYSFLHIFRKEKEYSVEFIFSLAVLVAGLIQAVGLPWLRMVYFPLMVTLTAFYGLKTLIFVLLLMPFLELNNIIRGDNLNGEIIFILSMTATLVISMYLTAKIKKRGKDKLYYESIKEPSSNTGSDVGIKSFSDEKVISHYLESMFKPDDEIKEILAVAKNTVFADSVNLFVISNGSLKLRCSTEESGSVIPSDRGIIHNCLKEKRPIVSSDIVEKKLEVGYLKKDTVSSLVTVPVMDGNFPLGVLAADSSRFHAFSSADSDIIQMFTNQVVKILQRERVYPQIYRSYTTLKVLNEESSRLLSSLNIDVIVQSLVDGAYRISPATILFFISKGNEFEILHHRELPPLAKKDFSIKRTLLDMVVKNKEPFYLSDVRNYRSPIMPFKIDNIGSVFILPMIYEKDLLGILTILSEETNALNPYQIELLKILGNQASISMANAKFHAEIEKLAITDGLTGLFNHRHFQERLSQEFKRMERFPEPMSLLIIDIDYFKKINDSYGHPVGDSVLKKVTDIIRKTIRNIDVASRYGGEEFAVILIGTDARGAKKMAERLRKAVMNMKFSADTKTFSVTISIGISTYPDSITGKEELIERADKALYHAKDKGRNCCVLWSEIDEQNL
jgi:diguanylate cyclase (GGDEF)-like protein